MAKANNDNKKVTPKYIPSPAKVYTHNIGRSRVPSLMWEEPEWDLAETGRILDTESLCRRAFRNKKNLWLKEGYDFTSNNVERAKYIEARLQQIEEATGISTQSLISSTVWTLIRCSNAFWVKKRDVKRSGGKIRKYGKKNLNPVAGYFPVAPETIRFKRDENGTILKYKQCIRGKEDKEFDPEDVIHFHLDKREGYAVAPPTLVSVKDDIRALRRIEENVELLIYQHLFPLFHYKVGTSDAPATIQPNGQSEVDTVIATVQAMPSDGCWVTPERHEIKVLGAEGNALAADKAMEYFKQRIFTGLGNSSVDMGEGGCHDEKTQVLTDSGWKFHFNIDHKEEKIATFNPETNKVEFHIPNSKYEGFYKGKIYQFKNKHLDIKVTPKHEMWIAPKHKPDQWQKVYAEDLYNGKYSEFFLLETAEFEHNDCSPERVIELTAKGFKKGKVKDFKIKEKELAELLGYYISEGCLDRFNASLGRYRVVISQNYGDMLDRMMKLLNQIGLPFSQIKRKNRKNESGVRIYGKALYQYLEKNINGLAKDKFIPELVNSWSRESKEVFLSALIAGDGSIDNREGRTSRLYHSASEKLANDVQILAMSLGYSAKVTSKYNQGGTLMYLVKISNSPNTNCTIRHFNQKDIIEKEYKDYIYCYNVENHLFVTRRNGKVTIQGNSASRSTAQTMSRNLIDDTKADQREFGSQFYTHVIRELLLESTYFQEDLFSSDNKVVLKFNEIDFESRMAKQNHYTDLYLKNIITHPEARVAMGLKPFEGEGWPTANSKNAMFTKGDGDWAETNYGQIERDKIMLQSIDEPGTDASKALTKSNIKANNAKTAGGNSISNKNQPQNQHGTRNSAKLNKDSFPAELDVFFKQDLPLSNVINSLREDTVELIRKRKEYNQSEIKLLIDSGFGSAKEKLNFLAKKAFRVGLNEANSSIEFVKINDIDIKIEKHISFYIDKLYKDIFSNIERYTKTRIFTKDAIYIESIFDFFMFRAKLIDSSHIVRAYNYGLASGYRVNGFKKIVSVHQSDNVCRICKEHPLNYKDSDVIIYEELPPFHPNCSCKMTRVE